MAPWPGTCDWSDCMQGRQRVSGRINRWTAPSSCMMSCYLQVRTAIRSSARCSLSRNLHRTTRPFRELPQKTARPSTRPTWGLQLLCAPRCTFPPFFASQDFRESAWLVHRERVHNHRTVAIPCFGNPVLWQYMIIIASDSCKGVSPPTIPIPWAGV